MTEQIEQLAIRLHEVGAVKFGKFKLKSGIQSPIYIDLRLIVSFPDLLQLVASVMWQRVQHLKFDVLCGVPYTALPMATCISSAQKIPMVMRRKEIKDYGTKQIIEGSFKKGQTCLVVEDLVTSGASVFETVTPLTAAGLQVKDVIVLIDREQGGRHNLSEKQLNLHAVFTISEMMTILHKYSRINQIMMQQVLQFVHGNQVKIQSATTPSNNTSPMPVTPAKLLTYGERSSLCDNPAAKRLLAIMEKKKTNLCASLDVTNKKDLLDLANRLGPYICLLKTHIDILIDFDPTVLTQLRAIADKHGFMLFEDRKFADIGNTVHHQYCDGVYRIVSWADFVNCHTVPGPGIISGLAKGGSVKGRGLLLLAEMSSQGNLATGDYTKATVEMAEKNKPFVTGFISQRKLSDDPTFIHMTPGVNLASSGDQLGQQYDTPQSAILQRQTDVIIVGRGIYGTKDVEKAAQTYRDAGWSAYLQRINKSTNANTNNTNTNIRSNL